MLSVYYQYIIQAAQKGPTSTWIENKNPARLNYSDEQQFICGGTMHPYKITIYSNIELYKNVILFIIWNMPEINRFSTA